MVFLGALKLTFYSFLSCLWTLNQSVHVSFLYYCIETHILLIFVMSLDFKSEGACLIFVLLH